MKTIKEVLNFCNEFLFYDLYSIERVIEINLVRDCVISVLSNCDFITEDKTIRVQSVIDDISLMVIDGNVEILIQEKKYFESSIFTIVMLRAII